MSKGNCWKHNAAIAFSFIQLQPDMKGKKILLIITGSIAAYKSAHLTRLLVKSGAEVQVIMTEAATEFISPLTLSTLSKRPVFTKIFSEGEWNSHVELGLWADVLIVAPATANSLGKMANGICDNLAVAVYLSARCPVVFAPAMDMDMWHHPSTQTNVQKLKSFGNSFAEVGIGDLASGLVGEGRMAEPEEILDFVSKILLQNKPFHGKKVLVTAGPTYEPLDPVRFIGNYSSGKMGIAIADSFARKGAEVTLILGPSHLEASVPAVRTFRVKTAAEMHTCALEHFPVSDIAVLAAAVADYRPIAVASEKIKKTDSGLTLTLEKNPDIAASLGQIKSPNQILVGFALETSNEEANALGKLERKNFDFIVLNSLRDAGAGFGFDTNKITILYRGNKKKEFELMTKLELADKITGDLQNMLPPG